jgi:hypothetical protein
MPFKLAAFFDLFSEELLPIEPHGVAPDKNEAASPSETASQIWGLQMSRSPNKAPHGTVKKAPHGTVKSYWQLCAG